MYLYNGYHIKTLSAFSLSSVPILYRMYKPSQRPSSELQSSAENVRTIDPSVYTGPTLVKVNISIQYANVKLFPPCESSHCE